MTVDELVHQLGAQDGDHNVVVITATDQWLYDVTSVSDHAFDVDGRTRLAVIGISRSDLRNGDDIETLGDVEPTREPWTPERIAATRLNLVDRAHGLARLLLYTAENMASYSDERVMHVVDRGHVAMLTDMEAAADRAIEGCPPEWHDPRVLGLRPSARRAATG